MENIKITCASGIFNCSSEDKVFQDIMNKRGAQEYNNQAEEVRNLIADGYLNAPVNFLDIGANLGNVSIGLMRAGLIDKAVAIEPEQENFNFLVQNIEENGFKGKIFPVNCAVGDVTSVSVVQICHHNHGDHRVKSFNEPLIAEAHDKGLEIESHRETQPVNILPLQDILNKVDVFPDFKPNLVWIDTQGFEGKIFQGGKDILKGLPASVEIWPYGILRSGITLADFCALIESIWKSFWVGRDKSPISSFPTWLATLGTNTHSFRNVMFTD